MKWDASFVICMQTGAGAGIHMSLAFPLMCSRALAVTLSHCIAISILHKSGIYFSSMILLPEEGHSLATLAFYHFLKTAYSTLWPVIHNVTASQYKILKQYYIIFLWPILIVMKALIIVTTLLQPSKNLVGGLTSRQQTPSVLQGDGPR